MKTGGGETSNIDKINGSFKLKDVQEVNGGYLRVNVLKSNELNTELGKNIISALLE